MINWKLRLQNKTTLIALLGAIFLMAQQLQEFLIAKERSNTTSQARIRREQ